MPKQSWIGIKTMNTTRVYVPSKCHLPMSAWIQTKNTDHSNSFFLWFLAYNLKETTKEQSKSLLSVAIILHFVLDAAPHSPFKFKYFARKKVMLWLKWPAIPIHSFNFSIFRSNRRTDRGTEYWRLCVCCACVMSVLVRVGSGPTSKFQVSLV